MKKPVSKKFNFKPLGREIKKNRKSMDLTQEKVAELLNLQVPYYSRIENNGQHPSLQTLYNLAQLLHISLDEYFLPDEDPAKTSKRLIIDNLLDGLSDSDLEIIEGTIKGILQAKKTERAALEDEQEELVLIGR